MLVNYATIIYTPDQLQAYTDFLAAHQIHTRWSTYYGKQYHLPTVVGISKSGYLNHQGVYDDYTDPLHIYSHYFSDLPLIPLDAVLQPANYPEYYI